MAKDERYWEIRRREHKHIQEQLKREGGYKKRLERLYRTAQEEIIRDIEADIGRFADKEGISMTEAKRRISKHDVEAFSEKAKRYVNERNFSPEANRELRLYNVTLRTNRLELLEARIHLETVGLADEEIKMLQEWLGQEAIAEYTRQAGILGMTVPDQVQLNRMAKAIINAEFRNVEFSERVWQNQKELQHGLENTIRRTIIRGENPRVAGRELRQYVNKEFENKKYAADRIAITESARVQTDIGEQAHRDAGITQYMWIAEPTACSICAGYDGEVYDYSDTGAPRVPVHPFCKCSEAAYFDSTELDRRLDQLAKQVR
jgi:SPP1 gp7 family putative phage head morphogenesis protein